MIWQTQIMTPKRSQEIRCSYAEYLQVGLNVQKVIIGQLLFREVLPYDMYNNHVVSANEEIAQFMSGCVAKNILLASLGVLESFCILIGSHGSLYRGAP